MVNGGNIQKYVGILKLGTNTKHQRVVRMSSFDSLHTSRTNKESTIDVSQWIEESY